MLLSGLCGPLVDRQYDIIYDVIMYKIVIDTDVMVAAFDSPTGASRQLILDILDGRGLIVVSPTLMLEYEAVLTRPKVLNMIGIEVSEVLMVLDELAKHCVPVSFDYRWRPAAADADDDLVLETAINGCAHVIATFNLKHMKSAGAAFGIAVERP